MMKKTFHGFYRMIYRCTLILIVASFFPIINSCEENGEKRNTESQNTVELERETTKNQDKTPVSFLVESFLKVKHNYLVTFGDHAFRNKENMDNVIKSMVENKKEMIKGLLLFEGDKSQSFFANSTKLRGGGLPNEILALYLIHSLLLEEFFFNRDAKTLNSPLRGHLYNDSFDFIVDTNKTSFVCSEVRYFNNNPYDYLQDYGEVWDLYKKWISEDKFDGDPIKNSSYRWLRLSMVENC